MCSLRGKPVEGKGIQIPYGVQGVLYFAVTTHTFFYFHCYVFFCTLFAWLARSWAEDWFYFLCNTIFDSLKMRWETHDEKHL